MTAQTLSHLARSLSMRSASLRPLPTESELRGRGPAESGREQAAAPCWCAQIHNKSHRTPRAALLASHVEHVSAVVNEVYKS
jgi:hypothetical protein